MSAQLTHARVLDALGRLRLRHVAERLDALLADGARNELTLLDFLDRVLAEEVGSKQRKRVAMGIQIAHFPAVRTLDTSHPRGSCARPGPDSIRVPATASESTVRVRARVTSRRTPEPPRTRVRWTAPQLHRTADDGLACPCSHGPTHLLDTIST